ncbi:unnamed protein product [Orchesella dallaii]|uniref:Uncharacterized protein n=1 Tax=Orchesella dallaii TaxID=48710 RepID=A0ABP1RK19_9HEXA
MASKVGLDILRAQISLASTTGVAPFHYNKKGILVANREKKCDKINKIWLKTIIIAVCYSCIEVYSTLKKMTTADVAKAAFQGFVLEFHIAELFTTLGIQRNKHNIPQLINCMQKFNLKYNEQLQAVVHKALQYGSKFGNNIFQWNTKEKRLLLKDTSHFKRMAKFKLVIHLIFGTLMMYEAAMNPRLESITLKSQAFFTSAIVLMGGDGVWNQLNKYQSTIQTVNELMKLEMELEKGGNKLPGEPFAIVGLLCKLLLMSAKQVCFAFGLPAFFIPEFPTNLFLFVDRFFSKTTSKSMMLLVTERILLGTGNLVVWYIIGSAAIFFWLEMIFALNCIRACLLLCLRKISTGHTRALFGYCNRLKLLVSLFNEAHSSVVIHLLGAVTFVQTLAAFILIRAVRDSEDMALIGIFCNLVAIINISVIILGIYGYAGSVFSTSIMLTKGFNTSEKVLRSRLDRKIAKSLSILKIKFGGSNFIDKRTPLVFLDFNIGRTVDLLLVDKRLHR